MRALAKPSVAWGYGAFFLCAVTCAHFDDVLHEPLSLISDWMAGGVLLVGGLFSAGDWLRRRAYQAAAWAFMVSLLFRSLVGDLEDAVTHAPDPSAAHGLVVLSTGPYIAIKLALFLFAVGGLFTTLKASESQIENV